MLFINKFLTPIYDLQTHTPFSLPIIMIDSKSRHTNMNMIEYIFTEKNFIKLLKQEINQRKLILIQENSAKFFIALQKCFMEEIK